MISLKYKPTITGEKVILRPFTADDFPDIEACLQDPEVIKLTGSTSDYDRELTLDWYRNRNEQEDRLDLAIVDKASDVLIGEVVANLYNEENHSMNFRILVGPNGRNRGIGTEATQLFIDYVFQNTDLNELTLSVFDFNPRAKHIYGKVGFVVVSVDKADLEFEGKSIDSINMKLKREDWLEKRS